MLTKMMPNVTCPNCGAALVAGAKFCRQCGRLVNTAGASSVAEATTRTLHAPTDYAAQPTEFLPSQPTSPAYLSPTETPPPPAYNTNSLTKSGRNQSVWLIGAISALLLVAVIALVIVLFNKNQTTATRPTTPQPPTVSVPGIPPPPAPPEPKTPTAAKGTSSINSELIYPGAETMMDMTNAEGGRMLQLRTEDSYQKVLDWYTAKLKPEQTIKSPGPSAVLKSERVMAIITGAGGETNIVLKQLDEKDFDIDLDK